MLNTFLFYNLRVVFLERSQTTRLTSSNLQCRSPFKQHPSLYCKQWVSLKTMLSWFLYPFIYLGYPAHRVASAHQGYSVIQLLSWNNVSILGMNHGYFYFWSDLWSCLLITVDPQKHHSRSFQVTALTSTELQVELGYLKQIDLKLVNESVPINQM